MDNISWQFSSFESIKFRPFRIPESSPKYWYEQRIQKKETYKNTKPLKNIKKQQIWKINKNAVGTATETGVHASGNAPSGLPVPALCRGGAPQSQGFFVGNLKREKEAQNAKQHQIEVIQ